MQDILKVKNTNKHGKQDAGAGDVHLFGKYIVAISRILRKIEDKSLGASVFIRLRVRQLCRPLRGWWVEKKIHGLLRSRYISSLDPGAASRSGKIRTTPFLPVAVMDNPRANPLGVDAGPLETAFNNIAAFEKIRFITALF